MGFKARLFETLTKLLTSGKVITAIVGLAVSVAAKRGIVLSPDDVNLVVGLFASLILAQGANDLGKGAAVVKAEAPAQPEQTQTVNIDAGPPVGIRR